MMCIVGDVLLGMRLPVLCVFSFLRVCVERLAAFDLNRVWMSGTDWTVRFGEESGGLAEPHGFAVVVWNRWGGILEPIGLTVDRTWEENRGGGEEMDERGEWGGMQT